MSRYGAVALQHLVSTEQLQVCAALCCIRHTPEAGETPVSCRDTPCKLAQHDNGKHPIQSVTQLAQRSASWPAKCHVICSRFCAHALVAAVGVVHRATEQQLWASCRSSWGCSLCSLSSRQGPTCGSWLLMRDTHGAACMPCRDAAVQLVNLAKCGSA